MKAEVKLRDEGHKHKRHVEDISNDGSHHPPIPKDGQSTAKSTDIFTHLYEKDLYLSHIGVKVADMKIVKKKR